MILRERHLAVTVRDGGEAQTGLLAERIADLAKTIVTPINNDLFSAVKVNLTLESSMPEKS